MKKLFLLLPLLALTIAGGLAQNTGEIRGKLFDAETKESLVGAHVLVLTANARIGTVTDYNGNFVLKPLPSGKHTIVISFIGYKKDTIYDINVAPNSIAKLSNIYLPMEGITLTGDYGKTERRDPLIDINNVPIIRTEELEKMPDNSNLANVVKTMSSSIYVNENNEIYFRGARNDNFVYIIDGVKAMDSQVKVASGSIGSIQVYTGGVPAIYGDFTGGCVVIETKGYYTN